MNEHTTALITAYAVNPYKGSEDGSGWNIIWHLAHQVDVIAITRCNNAAAIQRFMAEHALPPGRKLQWLYFDLPTWMRFWKKGARGAMLYHYLWHLGVVFFILRRRLRFDVAHHLNFHNDWTPSFLWLLRKPLIWGPIGHHHKIPTEFLRPYGRKAWLRDRLLWWTKWAFWRFDPFLKITRSSARKILCMNSSVRAVLPIPEHKHVLLPPTASERAGRMVEVRKPGFTVLSVGRFVPLKGFDVTVRAFARFYRERRPEEQKCLRLVLIGRGPCERAICGSGPADEGLPADAVEFIPWIERSQLAYYYATASAFLFPSHEGAGMVVVEAMSYGLPVLCFKNYGPGEFTDDSCAIRVPYGEYDACLEAFARGLHLLFEHPALQQTMGAAARKRFEQLYTYDHKARTIAALYAQVLERGKAAAGAGVAMAAPQRAE
ncbi:MAG: hypothetical protein KatS3mg029_0193 [Saprospiraceae bacterium]|nr:MAG: hypothetical protein KatS3mg029_0193 [Saprospiraceae bacterium]